MTTTHRHRLRIRFAKEGVFQFTSHRDLVRAMERTFRRAGLQLAMSEGFHPKPRMSFPLALALGVVGENEVMELELANEMSEEDFLGAMRTFAPAGLRFESAKTLPQGSGKAKVKNVTYRVLVPSPLCGELQARIQQFLAEDSRLVAREDRGVTVDIRSFVESIRLSDGVLEATLRVVDGKTARPREIMQALQIEQIELDGGRLTRTKVEICQS